MEKTCIQVYAFRRLVIIAESEEGDMKDPSRKQNGSMLSIKSENNLSRSKGEIIMMTERWSILYTSNGNHNSQFKFPEGGWCCYRVGMYDSRDIMCDDPRPHWDRSGEYMIGMMKEGARDSSDAYFTIYCDKAWMNRIVYNLQQGQFKSVEALERAATAEGKKRGTYEKHYNIVKGSVTLREEAAA